MVKKASHVLSNVRCNILLFEFFMEFMNLFRYKFGVYFIS